MHDTVGRSREGAAEIGQLAIELVHEQIRHNLAIVSVIDRATNWDGMTLVQADFIWSSLARINLFTTCCFNVLRASVAANPPATPMMQTVCASSTRYACEAEREDKTKHRN